MKLQRGPGVWLTLALLVMGGVYLAASRLGYVDRAVARLFPSARRLRLSSGDFPSGVAAPLTGVASVPLRPVLVGFTPRGTSATLLLAASGIRTPEAPPVAPRDGLLKTAYALDTQAVLFSSEDEVRQALALGGDNGGVDMAALSVDRLAQWAPALRDAAPHTVLLLGRSRGQEALAAVGVDTLEGLKGKRVAVHTQSSSFYFGLWLLARAGLLLNDVTWVELPSSLDAGRALREGRADAVLGLLGDVEVAAKDRGGKVLATTADAPHLVATVLVVRGEFAARYPDAVRRVLRGLLDAQAEMAKNPGPAARLLGEVAPYLGDPHFAIESAPPADLAANLAFFGIAGEAPVTYDELFRSAAELYVKLNRTRTAAQAEDTLDLSALKSVAEARGL
ncbi:MAG: ABC transporter substrate-binding protein [Myxococcaceae bacterium]|nr:ABC transporter substrate-binding protein [Myxococcaceae bacterium]